jgi:hypothetical protein
VVFVAHFVIIGRIFHFIDEKYCNKSFLDF